MSTIKVNKIENTATADGGIAIDASGHVQIDGVQLPNAGALSHRNKIINGDMRIDQRNAGASVSASAASGFSVDRWSYNCSPFSKYSLQQSTTAPAGFTNSVLITTTTAHTPSGGDFAGFRYNVEGYDVTDLGYGTADAVSTTLSFYVRSSLTGEFSGSCRNSGDTRSFVFTYTINTANTWEQKTITIPGDTSGTWLTNEDVGLSIFFNLGTGSTFSTSIADAWQASNFVAKAGSTSLIATNGATLNITGVQLEVGEKATRFEHRLIGDELARCERYFQTGSVYGYNQSGGAVATRVGYTTFTTKMRVAPTLVFSNTSFANCSGLTAQQVKMSSFGVFTTATSATNMNADFDYTADSEL